MRHPYASTLNQRQQCRGRHGGEAAGTRLGQAGSSLLEDPRSTGLPSQTGAQQPPPVATPPAAATSRACSATVMGQATRNGTSHPKADASNQRQQCRQRTAEDPPRGPGVQPMAQLTLTGERMLPDACAEVLVPVVPDTSQSRGGCQSTTSGSNAARMPKKGVRTSGSNAARMPKKGVRTSGSNAARMPKKGVRTTRRAEDPPEGLVYNRRHS
jgi:hypothetical protein